MDELHYQSLTLGDEYEHGYGQNTGGNVYLAPDALGNALVVLFPVELGGEYPRSRKAAENTEIEHEQQLVDYGHAGHGFGAHLPHHDIVQQVHKVGDNVLHQDGQHDGEKPTVKGPVAYERSDIHNYLKKAKKSPLYCTEYSR